MERRAETTVMDGAERALVAAAAHGDRAQRDRLVESFMPAIRTMARQYRHYPRVDQRELVQAGVVGFLSAVDRYDPAFGTPLWAYAAWWVRAAMQQVVAELSCACVLSDRALRTLARVRSAEREHGQAAGRGLRPAEVARLAGVPAAQLEALVAAARPPRGFDEPVSAGADLTIADLIEDVDAEEPWERAAFADAVARLGRLLETLEPRERMVLAARFPASGSARTLGELGGELGLSAERVRQIEQHALARLRDALC
jgi:RNA polymerase primary sigma factor